MVPTRSRFGVFLLTIAAAALCLSLLFTTASDAQTRAESQNATAAAGGEDCLEFEDEAADETDETGEDDADEDAEIDAAEEDGDIDEDADDDLTSQDGDANLGAQQAQDENQSSFRVQNDNTGAFQQSLQTDQSGGLQQSLQADPSGEFAQSLEDREEDDGGPSPEDTDGDNADTSEDGENADTTDDDNNNETDDNDTDNNDDEQDAEGDDEEECVIAESVPDEPLLPTGAPAKAGSNETAKDKSGSEKQGEDERKTEGKSGGKQADSAGKRTGGGKELEVQDRGKKIEVEDRSGKTPRQEKSGSRTKSVSPKDERQEKARSGNSSSEKPRTESARPGSPRAGSERPDPDSAESSRTESVRASDLAPRLAAAEWSSPSREEIDLTERPRRFAPDPGAEMTLSVRSMGLYDVPVANSNRLEELDRGLVRMPETSLPWDASAQRNVFVAGHYLGLPETQSRMVFYNLDKLKSGDEMVLKDNLGQTYKYRVSEKFAAGPEDSWVMGEVRGRDMLTLQTCIPPDFGKRLVVRADRVQ